MQHKIKIIGKVAITLGVVATLLCMFPFGIFFALMAGFLGTITSCIYIFYDTRYEINTNKLTIGVWALLFSSVPILLLLGVIIMSHFK